LRDRNTGSDANKAAYDDRQPTHGHGRIVEMREKFVSFLSEF
jgi:hypothetical protein